MNTRATKGNREMTQELRFFNENLRKEVGAAILKYKEDNKLTREQLIDHLQVSHQTLHHLITQKELCWQFSIEILFSVAKKLNKKLLITMI